MPPQTRGESIASLASVATGLTDDTVGDSDSPKYRGRSAAQKAPKSYRRLVDGIATSESEAAIYKREALQTSFEIAELRHDYRCTMEQFDMVRHEEGRWRAEIERLKLESAAIWQAHEQPLQDQEEAVQTSARLVAALELRAERRSSVNESLGLECQELQALCESLRSETTESEKAHVVFTEHFERSESSAVTLAKRCNDWDQKVEVLQSKVTSEKDCNRLMEAEIEAAYKQMDIAKFELSDMERRCQGSVMSWWQQQGSRCQSLAMESEVLQQELELGKQELEYHVEESAQWREQAYRSEAGILQLRRGDVASGIRSICDQCTAYANAPLPSPP